MGSIPRRSKTLPALPKPSLTIATYSKNPHLVTAEGEGGRARFLVRGSVLTFTRVVGMGGVKRICEYIVCTMYSQSKQSKLSRKASMAEVRSFATLHMNYIMCTKSL